MEREKSTLSQRKPDCVTEVRIGNSILVVSGFFKQDATATAADKMARAIEAEGQLLRDQAETA